jgi:hypothetical protein
VADEREGSAAKRERERLERAAGRDDREGQADRRQQAQINREVAATERKTPGEQP